MKLTVLGAGAFGTAIANMLAENGHKVTLWCYEQEVAHAITATNINSRYLPGINLHKNITATTSLQEALQNSLIFEAVPVAHLRTVLTAAQPYCTADHQWVVLSKGIEKSSCLLPSQILKDLLPSTHFPQIAVLSGPSYAQEVATHQQTGVMLASEDHLLAQQIQLLVTNSWFTTEISDDFLGVQLCAAYKNVAALYLGILAGAGAGENARAQAFLQCLEELKLLVQTLGDNTSTVYGPAGLGDMLLTCYGKQSRNHTAGILLGKGGTLEAVIAQLGTEPEGFNSVVAFQQWAKKNNLTLPICSAVHEIIFNS